MKSVASIGRAVACARITARLGKHGHDVIFETHRPVEPQRGNGDNRSRRRRGGGCGGRARTSRDQQKRKRQQRKEEFHPDLHCAATSFFVSKGSIRRTPPSAVFETIFTPFFTTV